MFWLSSSFQAQSRPKRAQKALDSHPELLCRSEGKFMVFRKELSKVAVKYSDYLAGHQKKVFGEEYFPEVTRPEFDRLYRAFMAG